MCHSYNMEGKRSSHREAADRCFSILSKIQEEYDAIPNKSEQDLKEMRALLDSLDGLVRFVGPKTESVE